MNSLEIPKGAFNQFNGMETAVEAAQREPKEETGISATDWLELATVHTILWYLDDTVHIFSAQCAVECRNSLDNNERIEVIKLTSEEVIQAINSEVTVQGIGYRITNATTTAALFMAHNVNKK